MFASKTLAEHVLRGLVGFACVLGAMTAWPVSLPGWLELLGRAALAIGALVSLRGCPMCWLYGLVETLLARFTGRSARVCPDGTCTRSPDDGPWRGSVERARALRQRT